MGGPWKAQGFDPAAWRPPAPQVEAPPDPLGQQTAHDYTAIVIAYVASVVTSLALMVAFLKYGW